MQLLRKTFAFGLYEYLTISVLTSFQPEMYIFSLK